jgi:CelD/BcsL family acetyltransferase involved in cellulose biosynthesis
VFQTYTWLELWCRHYLTSTGADRQLAIVTGRRHGRLVLLLPLIVERVAGLRQLAWMGDPVSQYGELLAAPDATDPADVEAAFRFAASAARADLASLRKVRADAAAAKVLDGLGASITSTEEAPFVAFARGASFEDCEAQLSAKGRKNRRRHMRRLQETGEVDFWAPRGAEAAQLAARAIAMKRDSLESKAQLSRAFLDERLALFFAEAAETLDGDAQCLVTALRCAGEIGAVEIALEHKRRRFLHVAVYDPRFEKCGAGGLLLERALRDSFDAGIETFDLLAPRHGYKMEFCSEAVEVRDYALPLSLRGHLYCNIWLRLRPQLKRLIEQLPAPWRRLAARGFKAVRGR